MNIKHLKPGDAVILRRINRYGRYEFKETTIQSLLAAVVRIGGVNFRRDTGFQSGAAEPGAFSRWEAFPADNYEARTQLEQKKAGTLPPAVPEWHVRLVRAVDRLHRTPADQIDVDARNDVIRHFGEPADYAEADAPPPESPAQPGDRPENS